MPYHQWRPDLALYTRYNALLLYWYTTPATHMQMWIRRQDGNTQVELQWFRCSNIMPILAIITSNMNWEIDRCSFTITWIDPIPQEFQMYRIGNFFCRSDIRVLGAEVYFHEDKCSPNPFLYRTTYINILNFAAALYLRFLVLCIPCVHFSLYGIYLVCEIRLGFWRW